MNSATVSGRTGRPARMSSRYAGTSSIRVGLPYAMSTTAVFTDPARSCAPQVRVSALRSKREVGWARPSPGVALRLSGPCPYGSRPDGGRGALVHELAQAAEHGRVGVRHDAVAEVED